MVVYTQLRVSCGLSAIVNGIQPQDLKISPSETFAHWLDSNWLRLTNNNDPMNPLADLCFSREHKWVAVLDYILLRKVRSSFLLCKNISPGGLSEADVGEEHITWSKIKPIFSKVFTRLNQMQEDWPLWNYNGEFDNPEKNMGDDRLKKEMLSYLQSFKVFYEIWQSNISIGPDADWKMAISLPSFPEFVTPQAVYNHLDHFKTNHELNALLNALGWVASSEKSKKPYAFTLVNRPAHWVVERGDAQGTILDSLTGGTDSVRMGDTPYNFIPVSNMKLIKKVIPNLKKIFPDIEIDIEDEGLTEFPPLELPVTDKPLEFADNYHEKAKMEYSGGNYKDALIDKRIECHLLRQSDNIPLYFSNLIEFTDWCFNYDKPLTAHENLEVLKGLEDKLTTENLGDILKFHQFLARYHSYNEEFAEALAELNIALELVGEDNQFISECYEISNGMGVMHGRNKSYSKAIESFTKAQSFALKAIEVYKDEFAEDLLGAPMKYWPAILTGLDKKVLALNVMLSSDKNSDGSISKVE